MIRKTPPTPPPGRLGLSWLALWLPFAALTLATLLVGRQAWPGLVGDEATYLMAAESLGYDADLYYTRADHDRFVDRHGERPEGLILQSGDGGQHLVYAKPVYFPLLLAPFVRLAPERGLLVANLLWLALAAGLATRALGKRAGRSAPGLVALAIFGSVTFAYVFWAQADLFLAGSTAIALALLPGPPPGRMGQPDARRPPRVRYLAAGALLAVVAISRPFYLPLLPAAIALLPRGDRRRGAAWLALGVLVLAAAGTAVRYAHAGTWTAYTGERRAFYGYTGFPEVELDSDRWPELLAASGNAAWVEASSLGELPPAQPRLVAWNTLYLLAGRHVGLLPYFLPLVLLVGGRPRGGAGWALLAAVTVSIVGFLLYRPFNFWGGGAALANRYFLPLYPALWFVARRPVAWRRIVAVAVVAAAFLWPLWSGAAAGPRDAEGGYRQVSALAARWLPFETSQSHLKPSGQPDLLHHGLWMRLLNPSTRYSEDRGTLFLAPGRRAEILVGTHQPIAALELVVDSPEAVPATGGAARSVEPSAAGGRYRVPLSGPTARHPMWWTEEPFHLYRLTLRFESPGEQPVAFSLHRVGEAR